MNSLLALPLATVTSLSSEGAVTVIRSILRAECGYSKIGPSALTISSRLTIADGGIDAEVNTPSGSAIPSDCIFASGLTGFQIKAGSSFKPWTPSAIRGELLDSRGDLYSEVRRLVERRGRYVVICTGHDLTPKQRNESRQLIVNVFSKAGFTDYEDLIEVIGASQLADFAERYPEPAALLATDPIQEGWVLDEWQRDAHMANTFEATTEQAQMIERIQAGLLGDAVHIRILGEPGLGKTRMALEAVREPNLAPFVLYLQHGSKFGQTKLFRKLVKEGWSTPLILVLDELPEAELADVWRHLKPRCGSLKIVSLDHGSDETYDSSIERLNAPRLPDQAIQKILINRVGASREIDKWVSICDGSPRVALAVADNLVSNPGDLLRAPATVPIWSRFLHGYCMRDDKTTREVDCVTQHLALFSRFGFEEPVSSEAEYISRLVQKVDPTIGWARFQEIVQMLRARRVLQGSRTLFFVPKALHIHLWKQFWERYGRGFDFTTTFKEMPPSLHTWFLSLFKFAGTAATSHIIENILRPDGIFSDHLLLTSATGGRFLSVLAEANPSAVLRLLEATIGTWSDEDLLSFRDERQSIVWTLEKIAVWPSFTVRAIKILARLAVNENADFSNNSTGTLVGLFRIGPEAAATEASPEMRLPALLALLRTPADAERTLALKVIRAVLDHRGGGFRIVGPEYQGLKQRAKLWSPATYGDWWQANAMYFKVLIDETCNWPLQLRPEVCKVLLHAVESQIRTPPCTEMCFQVLDELTIDPEASPRQINRFFWHWHEYEQDEANTEISRRLQKIARRYAQQDLASRVQRYVIDVDWSEWNDEFRERHDKPKSRARALVTGLAQRIAGSVTSFLSVEHLLTPNEHTPALWDFGGQLACYDTNRELLSDLTRLTIGSKHHVCLLGYLSTIKTLDPSFYNSWINKAFEQNETAWLGTSIVVNSDEAAKFLPLCLDALDKGWIEPHLLAPIAYGQKTTSIQPEWIERLLQILTEQDTKESLRLAIELMDSFDLYANTSYRPDSVLQVLTRTIPHSNYQHGIGGHHWKSVCTKLIERDPSQAQALLDVLLTKMGESYELSYDSYVAPMAAQIASTNPLAAWSVIKEQFERSLPQWRSDLFSWLKGGLIQFDETTKNTTISNLPLTAIMDWIAEDVATRAGLIAHTAPRSLDDDGGGRLTRELLTKYGDIDGVQSGISSNFHTGGWTGPASAHFKRKREKLRRWLASGFEFEVNQWIEAEIEYIDRKIEREETNEERSRFD